MFETILTKAQFIAAPDASLLAYDEYNYISQNHVLKVMEPDGANAVSLTNFSGGSLYPIVWSPDSQWIAFNYYSSFSAAIPSAEVYLVNRNGVVCHRCIRVRRSVDWRSPQWKLPAC